MRVLVRFGLGLVVATLFGLVVRAATGTFPTGCGMYGFCVLTDIVINAFVLEQPEKVKS